MKSNKSSRIPQTPNIFNYSRYSQVLSETMMWSYSNSKFRQKSLSYKKKLSQLQHITRGEPINGWALATQQDWAGAEELSHTCIQAPDCAIVMPYPKITQTFLFSAITNQAPYFHTTRWPFSKLAGQILPASLSTGSRFTSAVGLLRQVLARDFIIIIILKSRAMPVGNLGVL